MALALSLPPFEEHTANPPETRPAHIQPWLDGMLARDVIEAAALIGDALAATNRVALSPSRRQRLVENYYRAALSLWPKLEGHFSRATHPLTGHALAAAKASLTLAAELATAYKHLLAHEAGKHVLLANKRRLVELLHRCLHCTARVLVNSYLSYSPVPPRTWHDAHEVYMFARRRKLQQTPVFGDSADSTPERMYVQALLLALANPYGFPPGQLAQVVLYLREHSHWAKITDVAPVHRMAKAVAIIPLGHDFPPFSANKGGNVEGKKLFLLTFDLAFHLQEQLRVLEAGGLPPASVGADPASKAQYIALLRQLLRQWAIPPARQFNRLPSRARVLTCTGLPKVWRCSRGSRVDEGSVATSLPAMSACQIINHTPGGYALRQVDTTHAAMRIGDLIALRVDRRDALQIAMVRWIRNTLRRSGLEFGCELLTDQPEAAAARPDDAEGASFLPAIVLAGPARDGAAPMLLLPADVFEVEHAIYLRRGNAMSTAVLTKLVEQGPGFELFEFVGIA